MTVSKILVLLLLATPAINGWAADWRLVNMRKGGDEVSFIDYESMSRRDGVLRFWFETVSSKELNSKIPELESPDGRQLSIALQEKAKAKYVPPYLQGIRGTEPDEEIAFRLAILEAVASRFQPNARAKVAFEIDCAGRQSRTVAVYRYRDDGGLEGSQTLPSTYTPIIPETMLEDAWKRFCMN